MVYFFLSLVSLSFLSSQQDFLLPALSLACPLWIKIYTSKFTKCLFVKLLKLNWTRIYVSPNVKYANQINTFWLPTYCCPIIKCFMQKKKKDAAGKMWCPKHMHCNNTEILLPIYGLERLMHSNSCIKYVSDYITGLNLFWMHLGCLCHLHFYVVPPYAGIILQMHETRYKWCKV